MGAFRAAGTRSELLDHKRPFSLDPGGSSTATSFGKSVSNAWADFPTMNDYLRNSGANLEPTIRRAMQFRQKLLGGSFSNLYVRRLLHARRFDHPRGCYYHPSTISLELTAAARASAIKALRSWCCRSSRALRVRSSGSHKAKSSSTLAAMRLCSGSGGKTIG